MSYRDETVRDVMVENVPCGFPNCASDKPAVHVLLKSLPIAPVGTPLCAYHSPFDVIADREAYDKRVCDLAAKHLAEAIAFELNELEEN